MRSWRSREKREERSGETGEENDSRREKSGIESRVAEQAAGAG